MNDLKKRVDDLVNKVNDLGDALCLGEKRKRVDTLQFESGMTGFWDDQRSAQTKMMELGELRRGIEDYEKLSSELTALSELIGENEVSDDLLKDIKKLEVLYGRLRLETYLSGKYDGKNAIVTIHAGQGGTEAMDWTQMLFRMYVRYCEGREWKTEVLDETVGEEAGIKSVSFKVAGRNAFGYLKNESGTHRLVRQSPFNADNLRQTSFAAVEVLPELLEADAPDVEIKDEDLDWQFYRAGGKGGQNVNKVSTAVRLIHRPSGIVVTAQTERHQEQNRENALSLLRAKLCVRELERRHQEKQDIKGDYVPPSWGTQIRSYVLHPYKMVKDVRTGVETGNAEAVLDGRLDEFIEGELGLTS